MLMNKEQIMDIIPHRDPFLLVDEVVEMVAGSYIIGNKYVNSEEYYFKGHFPQEPVMPGVLIVETLAQAGAIAVLSMEENKGKIAYFGSIKNAKFRRKVVPGETLRLEVTLEQMRSRGGTGKAKAYVGEELACQCEIMFMIG